MAHKKRSGPEDALDKAMGGMSEAAGRVGGDKSLEAEGRVLRRKGELKTYLVKPHADGGWKAEAVAAGKELARSKTPSQLLVYKADGFEVQEEKTYE
jgi:uncharacterized protein YjbJ (UPF0337 family)